MLNFKTIALVCLLGLLQACMQQRIPFVFNQDVNDEQFFAGITPEIKILFPAATLDQVDSVQVYSATYKESYIESDFLLEWSELHDSSNVPRVKYLDVRGYVTRLYLCTIHTSPDDRNAAVFFSVKYDPDGECLGFGPAYLGVVNPLQGTVAFTTQLHVKQQGEDYKLLVSRQQNRKAGILFVSPDFTNWLSQGSKLLAVEKIVLLDPNKIGGYKPVVFPVKEILQDEKAMLFRYFKTLRF